MDHLERLFERYPSLAHIEDQLLSAYSLLESTVTRDGLILLCGNGGSAADCDHIVGELMKGFSNRRRLQPEQRAQFTRVPASNGLELENNLQGAIRAISLNVHGSLFTVFSNDCSPEYVFAQQVWGYGRTGDSLICISTSGNSRNAVNAAVVGKVIGMHVIGMTGELDSSLSDICDVTIRAPGAITSDIQEYHLPIYHTICLMLESRFFSEK